MFSLKKTSLYHFIHHQKAVWKSFSNGFIGLKPNKPAGRLKRWIWQLNPLLMKIGVYFNKQTFIISFIIKRPSEKVSDGLLMIFFIALIYPSRAYSTRSPCTFKSSPSRSTSFSTRKPPQMADTAFKITKARRPSETLGLAIQSISDEDWFLY